MFHFIPVAGTKQKLGEEKPLEIWTPMSITLKLNAIKPSSYQISIIIITHTL